MDPILLLVLIAILLVVPIWQTFRQNKQIRQIRQMQEQLAPGMEVVTGSGMHGIVVDSTDETVDLVIAEGVVTRWQRGAVARNLTVEQHKASLEEAKANTEATDGPSGDNGVDSNETQTPKDIQDGSADSHGNTGIDGTADTK